MALSLVLLIVGALLAPATDAPEAPKVASAERGKETLQTFAAALKRKDLDAARALAQPIQNPITPDELDRKIRGLSKDLSGEGASWKLHDARADATVVIVDLEQRKSKDARPDFDPILLIERDGNFKVLLDDPEEHGLNERELAASKRLLAWYEEHRDKPRK